MDWKAYKVVLRLQSAMHIGAGKVGNLQRTRTYVTGRNLWGALTSRLARDGDPDGKPHPGEYPKVGDGVHSELAFTYFFPTTDIDGRESLFPCLGGRGDWGYGQAGTAARLDEAEFRYLFLSTYPSTALAHAAYSAQEASLHEVECLTPYTRLGEPVHLVGYLFQREGSGLDWQGALSRLQIGGERGYGWGRVDVMAPTEIHDASVALFGTQAIAHREGSHVRISLAKGSHLLGHALAADGAGECLGSKDVWGPVEPLVGRETRADSRFGVHFSRARMCYVPGARIERDCEARIGRFGVWEASDASSSQSV